MGVSGSVQYDLDIKCYSDEHDEGVHMYPTDEWSDENNPILECPECGTLRAVDVHVVQVWRAD